MKKTRILTAKSAFSALLALLCPFAYGKPSSVQKINPSEIFSTKTAVPYSLTLSLNNDWNTGQPEIPVVTNFVNSGPYTLSYSFYANPLRFKVEYQAAPSDTTMGTNWVTLVPYPPPANGRPIIILSRDIVSTLCPGQRWNEQTSLTDFSTSAEGFYRITARMQFPEAFQFVGPADNPRNYRKVTINLYSNSVVIRRTKTGFVEVDPATGKHISPK